MQYARATGFGTIVISHFPDKDKMIRDLGADEIVRDGKGLAAASGADHSAGRPKIAVQIPSRTLSSSEPLLPRSHFHVAFSESLLSIGSTTWPDSRLSVLVLRSLCFKMTARYRCDR